ncbi:MAG TPA: MFS transporter [Chloroflexota bacterium]|nr:MFS transporter [Chloroflexota bacterium]
MQRSSLLVVYLTVFVDLLGFGIILPILPFYAERFGADGFWVGAVLTAYSGAQFIAAFFLGRVSDRIGRRPVLLASLAGSAISLALTGLAGSLVVLLASRVLAGAFGGSIATAQAYIADSTDESNRTKYLGMLGATIGMGFVFGPAIGAGLSGFGFSAAAFAAAALAAANLVFGFFKLPETRPTWARWTPRPSPARAALESLCHPTIRPALAAIFLATTAFAGMEATFALLGQERFGLDAGGMGLIFTLVGVVIAIVQGGLVGRLNAALGERRLALTGAGLMAVGLLVLPFMPTLAVCILALGVLAVGQGFVSPTLPSLLSLATSAGEQGETLGIGQSASAAARAVGPLIAGWLFDLGPALPYIVGAVLIVVAAGCIGQIYVAPRETVKV